MDLQKYIKQKLQQFKKTVFNSAKKKERKKELQLEQKEKKWSRNNEENINSKVHREKFPNQSFSNNMIA